GGAADCMGHGSEPPAAAKCRSRRPMLHHANPKAVPGPELAMHIALPLRTVNEDSPEVVHVGQGGPRDQQISKFLKEFGRIVVIKVMRRMELEPPGARQ